MTDLDQLRTTATSVATITAYLCQAAGIDGADGAELLSTPGLPIRSALTDALDLGVQPEAMWRLAARMVESR